MNRFRKQTFSKLAVFRSDNENDNAFCMNLNANKKQSVKHLDTVGVTGSKPVSRTE